MFFEYGDTEVEYLKRRDKRLSGFIDSLGHVYRSTDKDVFTSITRHIVGQQISQGAMDSVWSKVTGLLGETINPKKVMTVGVDSLRNCGMSARKAGYITDAAQKIVSGEFEVCKLVNMSDEEAIKYLTSLKGVGIWTAEMVLLFTMCRPDILSFGDFGIRHGMRMAYRHKEITKEIFERYRKRYSPYGSTASLYLWEIAAGKISGLSDPAPSKTKRKSK